VSAAEKYLRGLHAGMTLSVSGMSFPVTSVSYGERVPPLPRDVTPGTHQGTWWVRGANGIARRWLPRKVEPRYPGEGNRLARRTAKAKRKGGAS
jgi:hypothetical protein